MRNKIIQGTILASTGPLLHAYCLTHTHLECILGCPVKNFGAAGEEKHFSLAFLPIDLQVDSGSGACTSHIPCPNLNLVVDHWEGAHEGEMEHSIIITMMAAKQAFLEPFPHTRCFTGTIFSNTMRKYHHSHFADGQTEA
jgi:hypothetical protein